MRRRNKEEKLSRGHPARQTFGLTIVSSEEPVTDHVSRGQIKYSNEKQGRKKQFASMASSVSGHGGNKTLNE